MVELQKTFGIPDPKSADYQTAGNWVGVVLQFKL